MISSRWDWVDQTEALIGRKGLGSADLAAGTNRIALYGTGNVIAGQVQCPLSARLRPLHIHEPTFVAQVFISEPDPKSRSAAEPRVSAYRPKQK